MQKSSLNMARAAIAAALAVVILYVSAVIPTGKAALMCAASVSVILVRMRCGTRWALGCYAVSALLALLLLPTKGPAILYAVLMGYYPLVKIATERILSFPVRWSIRLGLFNLVFWGMYVAVSGFWGAMLPALAEHTLLLFAVANIGFAVYDFALMQIILIYLRKIDGRI